MYVQGGKSNKPQNGATRPLKSIPKMILFVELTIFFLQDWYWSDSPSRRSCSLLPPPGPALLASSTFDLPLRLHGEGPLWRRGRGGRISLLFSITTATSYITLQSFMKEKYAIKTCSKLPSVWSDTNQKGRATKFPNI